MVCYFCCLFLDQVLFFRIPFERGLDLAKLYGVEGLLRPLLEYMPPNGRSERTPTKEQVLGNINSRSTTSNQQNRKATGTYQHSTEKRMKFEHAQETVDEHSNSLHNSTDFRDAQFVNDVSLTTDHFFDFHDAKNYYNPYMSGYYMDPYMHAYPHSMPPPTQSPVALAATEPSSERHRSTIMSFFLNTNDRHDSILLHSSLPPDFDIDLVLDDQGHTALHWAAALANINLLTQLIQKGAQIDRLNFSGESALLRSVMVAHNHERQTFLDLLTVLKDIICIPDKKNRTVLHHICLAASSKGKLQTSIYYMQCLLEFIAKSAYDEAMSSQLVHSDNQVSLSRRFATLLNVSDFCGDTAVNIAARLGNRQLVDQLVEAGADLTIPNYIGLRPYDFGLQYQNEQKVINNSL
jgi:ankyrin repeat protein